MQNAAIAPAATDAKEVLPVENQRRWQQRRLARSAFYMRRSDSYI